jgi:transketolase
LSHHQLTNLTILIDHNGWQGFGSARDVASMYPLYDKLAPFSVELHIVDGHDVSQISQALAQPAQHTKVIVLQTTKGHGLPDLADTLQSHYLPISPDQLAGALDYFHGRSL